MTRLLPFLPTFGVLTSAMSFTPRPLYVQEISTGRSPSVTKHPTWAASPTLTGSPKSKGAIRGRTEKENDKSQQEFQYVTIDKKLRSIVDGSSPIARYTGVVSLMSMRCRINHQAASFFPSFECCDIRNFRDFYSIIRPIDIKRKIAFRHKTGNLSSFSNIHWFSEVKRSDTRKD